MVKRINIQLNSGTGIGTLTCVGGGTFNCGGRPGFNYPADTTVSANTKERTHYSQEFVDDQERPSEMPYSILWIGQRGVFIHEWPQLGGSKGCIHLLPGAAKTVYDWVDQNTRIIFTWQ